MYVNKNEYEIWLCVFCGNTLKIFNPDNQSYYLSALKVAQFFLLLVTEPFWWSKKMPKLLWHVLDLFWHYNFFANPVLKITRVSHFFCQNEAGFCRLNEFLWGNLVLVVILIQESKALYLCSNVIIRIGGHGWLMSSWSKCKSDEPRLVEP